MNMDSGQTDSNFLRYGMLVPLALMIASLAMGIFSYSNAKKVLSDDLNDAMIALANENSELWTRQDTIAALRQMYTATHKPLIYQATDVNFRNATLKEAAYFTLALVDGQHDAPMIRGNNIASDSILLVPENAQDGMAIQLRGFADCSMASVFAASDQTFPGFLFALSILSMAGMTAWRKRESCCIASETILPTAVVPSLDGIKLTPMQRRLTQMLLDAPGNKVDKATLCETLWGGKSNAEESLYTLVRRTKTALAEANVEIICNRGESYELRVKS